MSNKVDLDTIFKTVAENHIEEVQANDWNEFQVLLSREAIVATSVGKTIAEHVALFWTNNIICVFTFVISIVLPVSHSNNFSGKIPENHNIGIQNENKKEGKNKTVDDNHHLSKQNLKDERLHIANDNDTNQELVKKLDTNHGINNSKHKTNIVNGITIEEAKDMHELKTADDVKLEKKDIRSKPHINNVNSTKEVLKEKVKEETNEKKEEVSKANNKPKSKTELRKEKKQKRKDKRKERKEKRKRYDDGEYQHIFKRRTKK